MTGGVLFLVLHLLPVLEKLHVHNPVAVVAWRIAVVLACRGDSFEFDMVAGCV